MTMHGLDDTLSDRSYTGKLKVVFDDVEDHNEIHDGSYRRENRDVNLASS